MGRKAKRIRLLRRIAAKQEAEEKQTTLKNENSVKIEEMKAAAKQVIEEPVVMEKPKEEIIEPPKPEIKKQVTKTAQVAPATKPAAKKNTKAKTTSRSRKNKKK